VCGGESFPEIPRPVSRAMYRMTKKKSAENPKSNLETKKKMMKMMKMKMKKKGKKGREKGNEGGKVSYSERKKASILNPPKSHKRIKEQREVGDH
jgi:hypothetical protein